MKLKDMTTICQVHEYIISETNDLLKIKLADYDDIGDAESEVHSKADDILTAVDRASEMGQNMEDRLNKYKDAIEGLGYVRGMKK